MGVGYAILIVIILIIIISFYNWKNTPKRKYIYEKSETEFLGESIIEDTCVGYQIDIESKMVCYTIIDEI